MREIVGSTGELEDLILRRAADRYREYQKLVERAGSATHHQEKITLQKQLSKLEQLAETFQQLQKVLKDIDEAQTIIREESDRELVHMAEQELKQLTHQKEILLRHLARLLNPLPSNHHKNAVVEIRAGTGGEEAALFAGDLFRMYTRFCERQGWQWEVLSVSEGKMGGYKQIVFLIKGKEAYGKLRFESGVHRVQRVPITESAGRIHTSAASVVVLPEPEPVDVHIDEKEIKKETFRASGPGGQHMQKNETAVRLTHLPTGIVVECQDERSQFQNYRKALQILKARLYERALAKQREELDRIRRSSIQTGDRSVKIRTYNFPQNRVTDHRIHLTLYTLEQVMDGELTPLIEALELAESIELLKSHTHDEKASSN